MKKYQYYLLVMIGLLGPMGWASMSHGPVVVELFESQGCSSCPPSERTMAQLKQEFGDSVILLTFHVDYWDYLGWKDTFSDAAYTERQKMYARAFAQDSIYTPEMVVGGESGFNGSDTSRAVDEVRSRLAASTPRMQLTLLPRTSKTSELSIKIPPGLSHGDYQLLAVVVEDAASVHVLRGENSGATMSGNFAVCSITPISEGQTKTLLTLPENVDPNHTRVTVLVRGDSSKIISAGWAKWPRKEGRIE